MRHDFPFSRFEGALQKLYALLVFRRRFRKFGARAFVSPYATLEGMEHIAIGDDCMVGRRTLLMVVPDPRGERQSTLTLGRKTYIGRGCVISACGTIRIGDNVTFGDNAYLSAGQHGFSDVGTRVLEQPMLPGDVVIGNGAWIGYGTFISATRDISIGEGSIVSANSVVTKSVPAFTMVGGVPARAIRQFDHVAREWVRINGENGA